MIFREHDGNGNNILNGRLISEVMIISYNCIIFDSRFKIGQYLEYTDSALRMESSTVLMLVVEIPDQGFAVLPDCPRDKL